MAGVKGRSGTNKNKDKPWAEQLRMVMFENDRKALRDIAIKCKDAALGGDMTAIREIGDRLDGKPAQEASVTVSHVRAVELSDDELADIAVGSSEGTADAPIDPSQLN